VFQAPTKLFYEFGEFRLDTEKHRILRDGEIVAVTPKAVETLAVLIQQRGRLVERDDLLNSVWRDVAVEDGNLTVTISMLRKALGEKGNEQRFIETVPRLGYKFVAPVREVIEEVPVLVVQKRTLAKLTIDEETAVRKDARPFIAQVLPSSRHRLAVLAATTAVVALAIGIFFFLRGGKWNSTTSSPIKSLAVLPFKTINSDKESAHEGLGIADILITRLSNIKAITVRPTSSVVALESSNEDSISIANQLRVDAVLEGTIYRTGDKVRVTGRLLKVADQSVIWSGQFERTTKDELQLQNEIASQVVDVLALNLNSNEKTILTKRYTENADAYQLYLKGRYEWNRRNYEGLSESQRLFRNAIEKDPGFALAYVGLADSLIFSDDRIEVSEALEKALALDPNLAEGYATQGFNLTIHYWQWKEAEGSFRKSIELNSGYATAHHWYAILLGIEGRNAEAKAEMQRALEIDPLSYNFLADLGQIYFFNHEYDKAREYCNKALAIYPNFSYAHGYLYNIYLQTGNFEAAIDEKWKQQFLEIKDDQPANAEAAMSASIAEEKEKLRRFGMNKLVEQVIARAKKDLAYRDRSAAYGWALQLAFVGEKEKALDNLERAFENRAFMMAWVKADPAFDSLRSEPRYQAIISKMGL